MGWMELGLDENPKGFLFASPFPFIGSPYGLDDI